MSPLEVLEAMARSSCRLYLSQPRSKEEQRAAWDENGKIWQEARKTIYYLYRETLQSKLEPGASLLVNFLILGVESVDPGYGDPTLQQTPEWKAKSTELWNELRVMFPEIHAQMGKDDDATVAAHLARRMA